MRQEPGLTPKLPPTLGPPLNGSGKGLTVSTCLLPSSPVCTSHWSGRVCSVSTPPCPSSTQPRFHLTVPTPARPLQKAPGPTLIKAGWQAAQEGQRCPGACTSVRTPSPDDAPNPGPQFYRLSLSSVT